MIPAEEDLWTGELNIDCVDWIRSLLGPDAARGGIIAALVCDAVEWSHDYCFLSRRASDDDDESDKAPREVVNS